MRKLTSIILGAALTASRLFGNPQEIAIEEAVKNPEPTITYTSSPGSFAFDSVFPLNNGLNVFFSSDSEDTGKKSIKDTSLAIGNENFYIGASYGDLSTDTLLEDADILKVQLGLRPVDWFDISLTRALVDIPNMISRWDWREFHTPVKLFAWGLNANTKKGFDLNDNLKVFYEGSTTLSMYKAIPEETEDFKMLREIYEEIQGNMAIPFDHLNVKTGFNIESRFIDFNYKGIYDGFIIPLIFFNVANEFGINFHDESRKLNMAYNINLLRKPEYLGINSPIIIERRLDAEFSFFQKNYFVKANISAPFDIKKDTEFVLALGTMINENNLELFYNSANNSLGLQFSTRQNKRLSEESKAREDFKKFEGPKKSDISSFGRETDLETLHENWGNTLEDVVSKIKTEQDISDLIDLIPYKEHSGTFTARQEYEKYGYGVCRDTNGNLIPYLEINALGKIAYGRSLFGPFLNHVITIVIDKDGKFDIRNYDKYFDLNAETEKQAIEQVYPGAYISWNGEVTHPVSEVREAVEKQIVEWE